MEALTRRFWRSLEPTQRSHSSRCASAIQIVRPLESRVETYPTPTGLAEIVSDYFLYFTRT